MKRHPQIPPPTRLSGGFVESEHPRGQPENSGEFAKKPTVIRHDQMMDRYRSWVKSLSEPELDAMERYGTDSYIGINQSLREKNAAWANRFRTDIRLLDKMIAKAPPLTEDAVVFRGLPAQLVKWMERGNRFMDSGFVSTSVSQQAAKYFASEISPGQGSGMVAVIKCPKGTRGLYVDAMREDEEQAEFVLPRGSVFRFISKKGNRVFLRLEQQGEHGAK